VVLQLFDPLFLLGI